DVVEEGVDGGLQGGELAKGLVVVARARGGLDLGPHGGEGVPQRLLGRLREERRLGSAGCRLALAGAGLPLEGGAERLEVGAVEEMGHRGGPPRGIGDVLEAVGERGVYTVGGELARVDQEPAEPGREELEDLRPKLRCPLEFWTVRRS